MKKFNQPNLNEQGIISILTVTLLALILSLITVGFVRAMISNQRQALDYQLNTQAFYAAESGVNDAIRIVNSASFSHSLSYTNTCSGASSIIGLGLTQDLNSPSNIKYSCILVNAAAMDDIKVTLPVGKGKFYPVKGASALTKVRVSWGKPGENSIRSNNNLEAANPASVWGVNTPALLRVTFYYPGTNFNRNNLIQSQKTYFVIPRATESVNYSDGSISSAACSGNLQYECSAAFTITSIGAPAGIDQDGLYIRVVPIYKATDVKIEGLDSSGNIIQLTGAQYSVDSTGRANDVYKRISVRKDIQTDYEWPEAVIQTSNSLCKQFVIWGDAASERTDEASPACSF